MLIFLDKVQKHFEDGKYVIHHTPGIWNGIWSDMAIETTNMWYGHGDGGLTGITLNDECVKMWAYGAHLCSTVVQNLDEMRDVNSSPALLLH